MRLGTVLRKWHTMEELSVREVAKQIGTSLGYALSGRELEQPCDSGTMAAILLWLIGKEGKGGGGTIFGIRIAKVKTLEEERQIAVTLALLLRRPQSRTASGKHWNRGELLGLSDRSKRA